MNQAKRRQFLIITGALLAAPLGARAQHARRQYVVGAFISGQGADLDLYRAALRERLARHGFIEGGNLRIEYRDGLMTESAYYATNEFAAMKVDAIFATHTTTTLGVKRATKSIPVVFTWAIEPELFGIVSDLARPGGNVTGVTTRLPDLLQKRFEVAVELAPAAKRVGALLGTGSVLDNASFRPRLLDAAARKGVELFELSTSDGAAAIGKAHKAGVKVVLTTWNLVSTGHRGVLNSLIRGCREFRVALIVVGPEEAEAGGLIAYGTDIIDDLRRAADMLARVLKGEKPGDLAVDQAARFQLVLNLKTAKEIGIKIPQSVLIRADRVIE